MPIVPYYLKSKASVHYGKLRIELEPNDIKVYPTLNIEKITIEIPLGSSQRFINCTISIKSYRNSLKALDALEEGDNDFIDSIHIKKDAGLGKIYAFSGAGRECDDTSFRKLMSGLQTFLQDHCSIGPITFTDLENLFQDYGIQAPFDENSTEPLIVDVDIQAKQLQTYSLFAVDTSDKMDVEEDDNALALSSENNSPFES
jgi:hypothetical protein